MGEAFGNSLFLGLLFYALLAFAFIACVVSGVTAIFNAGSVRIACLCICAVCGFVCSIPLINEKIEDYEYENNDKIEQKKLKRSCTKLIYAVEMCDYETVEKLLCKKADPNEVKNGRTPLTSAFSKLNNENLENSDRIIEALLKAGADPNKLPSLSLYENLSCLTGDDSKLALKSAITQRRLNAVKLLVNSGAIIDTINEKKIQEIRNQGRKLSDVNPVEYTYPFMPVQWAFEQESFECAQFILEQHPACTIWYEGNETLLMRLMECGDNNGKETDKRLSVLQLLIENFAEDLPDFVNLRDSSKNTALHYYGKNIDRYKDGNNRLCSKLLEYGADVNACDSLGESVIHKVVRSDDLIDIYEALSFLCEKGADTVIKNKEGKYAIDVFYENHSVKTEKNSIYYEKIEQLLDCSKKKVSCPTINEKSGDNTDMTFSHIALNDPADNW